MASVAKQLKAAREAADMSLDRVAEVTKMKSDQVRALEQGNYDVFPARVFVKGFVKSYATLLKLDVAKLMDQLDAELGSASQVGDGSLPSPEKGFFDRVFDRLSRVRWAVALPVLLITLILAVSTVVTKSIRSYQERDPLEDLGRAVYQPPKVSSKIAYLPLPERDGEVTNKLERATN